METIYDHNPSKNELQNIADGMTKEEYISNWMYSKEHSLLDISILYSLRGDDSMAEKYRAQVPDLYNQWKWGHDNVSIPQ